MENFNPYSPRKIGILLLIPISFIALGTIALFSTPNNSQALTKHIGIPNSKPIENFVIPPTLCDCNGEKCQCACTCSCGDGDSGCVCTCDAEFACDNHRNEVVGQNSTLPTESENSMRVVAEASKGTGDLFPADHHHHTGHFTGSMWHR